METAKKILEILLRLIPIVLEFIGKKSNAAIKRMFKKE
jgi:hypothetical protein